MNGYNKGVRPVQDWRKATDVYIDLMIYAILGVDEKKQVLTTYIWYNQSWIDEFLTWDPLKFDNISKISIPTHWVWVPDIMVIELVETGEYIEESYVYLDYTGRIYNNKPFQIKSSCKFNIYYFPFDHQNCTLTFTSWTHTTQDINVSFWRQDNETKSFTSKYANDGEWNIVSVVPSARVLDYENYSFGEMLFFIILRRKPLFHTVNLILPSLLLMIMNIAGFYLPPESGERISFKITLLLGYSVFLLIVSDSSPPIGTPLIGSYFVMCMVLLVISVIECIFIVRIVHQQNFHRAVPKWVKTLVLEKMTTLLCIKDKYRIATSCNDASDVSEQKESSITEKRTSYNDENIKYCDRQFSMIQDSEVLLRILKEMVSIQESLKKNIAHPVPSEWLHVGYIIDTFLFRIFIIVVIVYVVSVAAIWAQWPEA
ncbi:5-hydroxytryptamine receptor 3A-like [Rhinoderma darwinii]|uniref:5-hydroxytryptamine receptor 3A-like n=1 Tax=Rhinoderma darwinii TaxID=43563 RepID=UPI003F67EBDC